MKREKDLSEAEFIVNLNNMFLSSQEMQDVYKKMEKSRITMQDPFTDEDIVKIVHYLTFFESISSLIARRVLTLDMINDLFAYRFFCIVNNPFVQQRELIKDAMYYRSIYSLHKHWMEYRKKRNMEIPCEEFSLHQENRNYDSYVA